MRITYARSCTYSKNSLGIMPQIITQAAFVMMLKISNQCLDGLYRKYKLLIGNCRYRVCEREMG